MAKLAVRLITLALVLFLANASITTVTVDSSEENPWGRPRPGGRSCEQQIKEEHYLQQCQKYMESCQRSPEDNDKHLDACCDELEELDRQCRCPALKQAMQKQMQQAGEMGREEMRELVNQKILSKCNMEPRRCTTDMQTHNRPGTTCEEQIEEQSNLKQCQRYIKEKQSSSRSYGGRRGGNGNDKNLDACCTELEELDRQCRCSGLKRAVQQQMRGEEMGREEERMMYQTAEKIMSKCEMEPRECSMSPRSWL